MRLTTWHHRSRPGCCRGPLAGRRGCARRRVVETDEGSAMESLMRQSSWDGHLLLVHDNEQQRRAGVAAWVRRGLQVGAKVLYTESIDVPPDRSLMGVLTAEEVCADAAVDRGQVQVLPAESETYSATFMERAVADALAAGYPTVRWSAEAE